MQQSKTSTKISLEPSITVYFCKYLTMEATAKPVVIDDHSKKILAVKALMRERDIARVESDFGKSDTLRDRLMNEYDVTIFDQNGGPSGWKFKDGSTKKLPAGIIEAELPGAVKIEKRKREEGSDGKATKAAKTDGKAKTPDGKAAKKEKEVVKAKGKRFQCTTTTYHFLTNMQHIVFDQLPRLSSPRKLPRTTETAPW